MYFSSASGMNIYNSALVDFREIQVALWCVKSTAAGSYMVWRHSEADVPIQDSPAFNMPE